MDKITITEAEFKEVVAKTVAKFTDMEVETMGDKFDPIKSMAMGMQNALFGALLTSELFKEEK